MQYNLAAAFMNSIPRSDKEEKPKGRALPAWYYLLLAVVIFLAAALTLSNHYHLCCCTRLDACDIKMDRTCPAYWLCMGYEDR